MRSSTSSALPKRIDPRRIERDFKRNDRLRSEGSRILAGAARAAGVHRLLAQSIAFMYDAGPQGHLHSEEDPLVRDPPASFARTANAVKALEQTTLEAGGTVLRYGYFYGPGSAIAPDGSIVADLRRRRMPVVGSGAGVWSFVHVEDAARPRSRRSSRRPASTTSWTTSRPRSRNGCRRSRGQPAPPPDAGPGVRGAPRRRRVRRRRHDRGAGRHERARQARARVDAGAPELAEGFAAALA